MTKRSIITQVLAVLLVTTTLLLGYYFFFLKPKIEIPKKLLEIEKQLAEKRLNLSQNRISIMELPKLNPEDSNFAEYKNNLINTIAQTNEEGIKALEKKFKTKNVTSSPNEFSYFINSRLIPEMPVIFEKNVEILNRQKTLLKKLAVFEIINKNLYIYDPLRDLGSVKFITEREELINRIANAINGLGEVEATLERESEPKKEIENLIELILEAQKNLEALQEEVENENEAEATGLLANLVEYFEKIRGAALEIELALLRSPEMVQLLTDETNLILEYDYWLEKIDEHQEKLKEQQEAN